MKSWQVGFGSEENLATFVYNVCFQCYHFWNTDLRESVRPICQVNTVVTQHIIALAQQGREPEYDLPTWEPATCGVFMAK